MLQKFSTSELESYLDEALPPERMAQIEEALRQDSRKNLQQQLMAINGRRDAGVHSLGEIWRRHRLSCPSREQLGSYLLHVLPEDLHDYLTFHLETIECRTCRASLQDLEAAQQAADASATSKRRQKYFQSSAGYLSQEAL